MKNVSIKECINSVKPFTKVEILFRMDSKIEAYDCYNATDAENQFKRCLSRARLMIGDVSFNAEITCRALQYGSTWRHVKQIIINQKIA